MNAVGAVRARFAINMSFTRCIVVCAVLAFASLQAANYQNPVLAGDHPDPSVIRVGDDYWATATTSEWAPLFPLLHSRDLVNWEHVGNIFERRPDWAVGNFWAPELFAHKGKFYVYYVGRKRGGPLSLAVATADEPTGPWTDHGPLIGQDAGSIDAFPVVDTDGTRYLIWKEDGNSRKQPTPLWIQKLSDDGLKLVGEMKELFRNDATWENNLVEGPAVIRRGDYWYLFYAANACCGRACSYGQGVARAKNLLGPWEKNPGNPLVLGNEKWKCPGHGTLVRDTAGRDWFLYHAYANDTFIYVGRQGVLDLVNWKADGWPGINDGKGTSVEAVAPLPNVMQRAEHSFWDDFTSAKLAPQWQWPQNAEPKVKIANGHLTLTADAARKDEFVASSIAVKTTLGDYVATAELNPKSVEGNESAGLSAFGDRENALGVSVRNGQSIVWKRQRNKHETLGTHSITASEKIFLRMTATAGHKFSFSVSTDGKEWKSLGANVDVEGAYLPPWDRGIRVALVTGGEGASVEFGSLRISAGQR
ncbi:MAG TPA: family 43 glycosylhydrolase [Verrucomicrobiae bacterium]|jgi:beta-xylosidase